MPSDIELERLSPTRFERLKSCGLAVYLSVDGTRRTGRTSSSPGARLGTAAHSVLAWAALCAEELRSSDDAEALVRAQWSSEIAAQHEQARHFPSERALGPPAYWPTFGTVQERLVLETKRLVHDLGQISFDELWVEKKVVSPLLPLQGTPDIVLIKNDEARIIDYKTGAVSPDDVGSSGKFRTQLLLYGALVRERGPTPRYAEVRPLGRKPHSVEISDVAIDAAISEAEKLLKEFNVAAAAEDAVSLAHPSQAACEWCPHLLSCPAIWNREQPDLGELQVVQGTVTAAHTSRVGSLTLDLECDEGRYRGRALVTGINVRRVDVLAAIRPGARVRIAGLRMSGSADVMRSSATSWTRARMLD